jgi:adiponectin receptor
MDEYTELISDNNSNLSKDEMPQWVTSNEFIIGGYRRINEDIKFYFKSIFRLHNETLNIWTHLLGSILYIYIIIFTNLDLNLMNFTSQMLIMNLYVISSFCTYCFSTIMHIFYPISENVCKKLQKLDYLGISLQISTSMQVFIYFSYFCDKYLLVLYSLVIGLLNLICLFVIVNDHFTQDKYKNLKVTCFIAQACLFLIPLGHRVLLYDNTVYDQILKRESGYFFLGFILFILCIVFYLGLIPERYYPGKLDIFGHSHQIFHVLSVLGSLFVYLGLKKIMDEENTSKCAIKI